MTSLLFSYSILPKIKRIESRREMDLSSRLTTSKEVALPQGSALPKIIHQIWYNFSEWGTVVHPPTKYKTFYASWKKHNPEWKMILWNEQNSIQLLQNLYPRWLPKFLGFKLYIQRADFFRWVLLYHFGGCYADMDCLCTTNIDKFLQRENVIMLSQNPLLILSDSYGANNACMMAHPFHPTVKQIIENMKPAKITNSAFEIFLTSGPLYIHSIVDKTDNNVLILQNFLNHLPSSSSQSKTTRPLVIHRGDGDWGFKYFLVLDLVRLFVFIVIIVCFIVLLYRILRKI